MENKTEDMDIFSEGFNGEDQVHDSRESEELPGEEIKPLPAPSDERSREILRFTREFPNVRAADVPQEVWRRVREGESLTEAYMRYESARLRQENLSLRQERLSRERKLELSRRSAGSQRGEGGGSRDPFDDGWDWEI